VGTRAAGEVELAKASGTTGPCRKVEGGKGRRGSLEKRRGTNASLYLADRRVGRLGASDAIPGAAGGEGVTGPLNRMA
jgi:hypothetical protein